MEVEGIISSGNYYTNRIYYLKKLHCADFFDELERNNNKVGFLLLEIQNIGEENLTNLGLKIIHFSMV